MRNKAATETKSLHIPTAYGELSEGWTWSRLDDVSEGIFDCPHSTPALSETGPYIVRTQDIVTGVFRVDRAAHVAEETYADRTVRISPSSGDLLYSREGTYFGVAAEVPVGIRVCLGQRMVLIRPDKNQVNAGFLRYWLNSPIMAAHIHGYRDGTVAERLNLPTIRALPIVVPPRANQDNIAAVLGAMDDKIELNRRMNATLEAMARALFQSWFVDFEPVRAKLDDSLYHNIDEVTTNLFPSSFEESAIGHIPSGWGLSTIGSKLQTVLGGTPSRAEPTYWTDGTVPWINSGKTNEFRIIDPSEWITTEALEKSATKLLPSRTTVLAITGATLGQVTIAEIPCCANQSVVAIPASEQFPTEFVYPWVKHNIDKLIASQTGGAQQHINKGNVDELALLCPDSRVMAAYRDKVKSLFDRIAANCFQTRTLTVLRDTLLPKLLSGEVSIASLSPDHT